jgi:PAS domain S-box-containing protein
MARSLTERLLDRAHGGVVSLDEEGVVTYWNPSAERMFGIERGQALGRPVADLIIPERFRAAHVAGIRRFLGEGAGSSWQRCGWTGGSFRSR